MQINPDESWLFFDQESFVPQNMVNFMILSKLHSCDIKQFQVHSFLLWPRTSATVLVVEKNG